jgi:anti-sigma B factor antagonist
MFVAVVHQRGDGEVRLVVTGELDLAAAPAFRRELRAAEARLEGSTGSELVVDLEGVTLLDSVGMGLLAGAARRTTEAGCTFHLEGVAPALSDLLSRTRLDGVLPVRDRERRR